MSSEFLIWNSNYTEGFCVITKLRGFKDVWLLRKGDSLSDKWPDDVTFTMSPEYPKDIKLSDNLFEGSYRVVSGRVKEVLTPLVGNSIVEFLPVSILNHKGRIASKDYFIMNPLDKIDCIDLESSGVDWNAIDPSKISSCEKLVINEDTVPDETVMFRPKFWLNTILLRRELAAGLSAAGLTGLLFLEPSKYTG